MKLFKKALVATAIFGAMGAQAADLTDAVKSTSKQGLEVAAAAPASSVRAIVREQLEAGDQITLTFGAGVTGITSVAVDGNNDATATAADNQLGLVYGSGTYKLTPVSVTTTSGITTVVLEVKTGDPVTKDSSFEIQVRGANIAKAKAAEATVTYSAKSGLTGAAKDTTGDNNGSFIVLKDQYSASIKTKANGVIQRDNVKIFKSGAVATNNTDADTIVITLADAQTLLSPANGVNAQAKVTIEGDFSSTAFDAGTLAANFTITGQGTNTVGNLARANDKKSISFTVTDTAANDGIAGDYTITMDNAAQDIKATAFIASLSVDADTTSATNNAQEVLAKVDAGKWELDATIINIPYFPVGFSGINTSVHFANESSAAADVIITAISEAGTTYSTANMVDYLPAKKVLKVSQDTVRSLLKDSKGNTVPENTKLSVTFNIDANDGDVNAYAFSQKDGVGRQSLVTSQQKGIK
ncbi:hypothetical protein HG263_14800 [Pseudoalteromonas sp. JBTF-M23]|uniref:Uncharacterized protein n=1 Tax=Pseudoalteromonas caenipelagi TaxID=2726988 RepID=A0A849VJ10_9GAMM|nr:hypothetical protein [Pseudoalteromonas caenipelagi]NOU51804.1 hypothetical protein [Pseudoalteromonas caenipelagi]